MSHDDAKLRIYLTHRAALINYAAPIVGCRMRAEDLVQEAYLRFVPGDGPLQGVDQPVAYLYRIVRNLALDGVRRMGAEARRSDSHQRTLGPSPMAPSPEEEALYRDELHQVDLALAELPAKVRQAFEMNRLGGHTFELIAEELGVSVATAGRWAQQALLHVAKRLRDRSD